MPRKKVEIIKIEVNGELVDGKECTKCGEEKALSEYGSNGKGGKRSDCKKCVKVYNQSKDVSDYNRKWYEENKETQKEYYRKWYEENKEKKKVYARKQYEENKLERKDYFRKQYEENKEYYRKWQKENKEVCATNRQRRRARKAALPDTLTSEQATELLAQGCSLTGTKDGIHLDHFIPLSWGHGGTTYENMIPLAAALNISKNANNPFEWIKTQEGVDLRKWNELVERLAQLNDMTTDDYEAYVYYCEANKRDLSAEGA